MGQVHKQSESIKINKIQIQETNMKKKKKIKNYIWFTPAY